ncbi:Uncharacterised protein [uncultured Blautia sp.]|nr:Uncharacterised protein [uncultured Blautia sp.]
MPHTTVSTRITQNFVVNQRKSSNLPENRLMMPMQAGSYIFTREVHPKEMPTNRHP